MPKSVAKENAPETWLGQFEVALEILKKAAVESRSLTVDEMFRLRSIAGWDEYQSQRQLRKMVTRLQLLRIAGSDDDRAAAQQAVEDAERIRDSKGSALLQQIEQLQRELSRLDSDVDRSQRRLQEMLDAKQQAKVALPDDLKRYFDKQRAAIKSSLYPAVAAIETELQHCRVMAEFDPVIHREERSRVPAKFWTTDAELRKPTLKPAFFAYQAECQQRISGLELQLPKAQQALDEALSAHNAKIDRLNW
jgi:hypothetical protein